MPRPRSARPVIRVTFELDPQLVERLNAASDRLGVSRVTLVTEALQQYLDALERERQS